MTTHLGSSDKEKAKGEKEALQGGLAVAELDAIEVEHRLAVGENERIQRQNLEHLQRRHQRTPALADDVQNWKEEKKTNKIENFS